MDASAPGPEPAPEATAAPAADAPRAEPASAGLESWIATLAGQLDEVRREVARLCEVQLDRARGGLVTALWRAGFAALALLALFGLLLAAALRLVAGLAGGLTLALGGRAWAGDLAAGLVVFVAIAAALWVARAVDRRARLARLVRKYAEHYPAPAGEAEPR